MPKMICRGWPGCECDGCHAREEHMESLGCKYLCHGHVCTPVTERTDMINLGDAKQMSEDSLAALLADKGWRCEKVKKGKVVLHGGQMNIRVYSKGRFVYLRGAEGETLLTRECSPSDENRWNVYCARRLAASLIAAADDAEAWKKDNE